MLVVHAFLSEPDRCEYLRDRQATLDYRYTPVLTPQEYEDLMNQGFRKFGALVFRPVCEGCRECRPIRIPVERFQPDRSQRRAWKRNSDLRVELARPTVDDARMALYRRYHDAQSARKGWPRHQRDTSDYTFSYLRNPVPSVEISFWEGDALRAVVLTDVTPNVVSGIYHYYDPNLYDRGIGTFCMLQTIDLARRLGKRWAYFGFYVAGCGSLAYKARFRPCEVMDVDGVWRELAANERPP